MITDIGDPLQWMACRPPVLTRMIYRTTGNVDKIINIAGDTWTTGNTEQSMCNEIYRSHIPAPGMAIREYQYHDHTFYASSPFVPWQQQVTGPLSRNMNPLGEDRWCRCVRTVMSIRVQDNQTLQNQSTFANGNFKQFSSAAQEEKKTKVQSSVQVGSQWK